MINIPNLITLLRLALVPVTAYFIARERYDIALPIFLFAALTDLVDGYIARRFELVSRVGAMLDPIADKLTMLVATVLLAWHALLPLWLALAIIVRDIVIVAGALAYRLAIGRLDIAPTWLSKVNTAVEFAVLLLVMAVAAHWIARGAWMPVMFVMLFATIAASGSQYVWLSGKEGVSRAALALIGPARLMYSAVLLWAIRRLHCARGARRVERNELPPTRNMASAA